MESMTSRIGNLGCACTHVFPKWLCIAVYKEIKGALIGAGALNRMNTVASCECMVIDQLDHSTDIPNDIV